MKVYITVEEDCTISGTSRTPEENTIEVEVPDDHPLPLEFGRYTYKDGKLERNIEPLLKQMKEEKLDELEKSCEKSIFKGFLHTVNSKEYFFTFDIESQINLHESERLFDKEIISEETWTVKCKEDCARACSEIVVCQDVIKDIMRASRKHKNDNIHRYRKILTPLVESATTIEEIKNIDWNMQD